MPSKASACVEELSLASMGNWLAVTSRLAALPL